MIMTTAALKLKTRLDTKISSFNERKLRIMLVVADVLSESQFIDNQPENDEPDFVSDSQQYGEISPEIAELAMGYEVAGSDAEIDNKIHEYLMEKYR